jgi:hypothetical protein
MPCVCRPFYFHFVGKEREAQQLVAIDSFGLTIQEIGLASSSLLAGIFGFLAITENGEISKR